MFEIEEKRTEQKIIRLRKNEKEYLETFCKCTGVSFQSLVIEALHLYKETVIDDFLNKCKEKNKEVKINDRN